MDSATPDNENLAGPPTPSQTSHGLGGLVNRSSLLNLVVRPVGSSSSVSDSDRHSCSPSLWLLPLDSLDNNTSDKQPDTPAPRFAFYHPKRRRAKQTYQRNPRSRLTPMVTGAPSPSVVHSPPNDSATPQAPGTPPAPLLSFSATLEPPTSAHRHAAPPEPEVDPPSEHNLGDLFVIHAPHNPYGSDVAPSSRPTSPQHISLRPSLCNKRKQQDNPGQETSNTAENAPGTRLPVQRAAPVHAQPRPLLERACKRRCLAPQPHREYLDTCRISLPGIQLGLASSDIPGAGLGVFVLQEYPAGTRLATYSGRLLSEADINDPTYDVTYVWSDLDQAAALGAKGRHPLIIDANPQFAPLDWGGMINDGLSRGANVTLTRVRDQVFVTLLVDSYPGMELYLEYGPEYWQAKFFSLSEPLRLDVLSCYNLTIIDNQCLLPAEVATLRDAKRIHKEGGQWRWGPPRPKGRRLSPKPRACTALLSWLFPESTPPPQATLDHWRHTPRAHAPATPPPMAANRLDGTLETQLPGVLPSESTRSPVPLQSSVATPSAPAAPLSTGPDQHAATPASPSSDSSREDPPRPSPSLEPTMLVTEALTMEPLWRRLEGQYGYKDSRALRIALSSDFETRKAIETYLIDNPNCTPAGLSAFIRATRQVKLLFWKPASRLLADLLPPHPISGYFLDWLLKEMAFNSNWEPSFVPSLDLHNPSHRYHLASHLRALALADYDDPALSRTCSAAAEWLCHPKFHPSNPAPFPPWNYQWSRIVASPSQAYSIFTTDTMFIRAVAPDLLHNMSGWAVCAIDTRLPSSAYFSYQDLEALANIPNYGLHTPKQYMPLKPPLTDGGDTQVIQWAIHSLSGLILDTAQHIAFPPSSRPMVRKGRRFIQGPSVPLPPPKHRKYFPSHVFGPDPNSPLSEITLPVDTEFDRSWRKG